MIMTMKHDIFDVIIFLILLKLKLQICCVMKKRIQFVPIITDPRKLFKIAMKDDILKTYFIHEIKTILHAIGENYLFPFKLYFIWTNGYSRSKEKIN